MYRIEITEVTEKEVGAAQVWQKISDEGGGKYAYAEVPNRVEMKKVERKVLTQEVETVDMPAVIKAINNL